MNCFCSCNFYLINNILYIIHKFVYNLHYKFHIPISNDSLFIYIKQKAKWKPLHCCYVRFDVLLSTKEMSSITVAYFWETNYCIPNDNWYKFWVHLSLHAPIAHGKLLKFSSFMMSALTPEQASQNWHQYRCIGTTNLSLSFTCDEEAWKGVTVQTIQITITTLLKYPSIKKTCDKMAQNKKIHIFIYCRISTALALTQVPCPPHH